MLTAPSSRVSGAGVEKTRAMVKTHPMPELDAVLRTVPQGVGHCYAFIGLRGSQAELRLPSHNVWVLPTSDERYDFDALSDKLDADVKARCVDKLLMFVGFPSAKDPTWDTRYPGVSTCVVITEGRREWFHGADWKLESGHRSEAYVALKKHIGDRLVANLLAMYPALEGRVAHVSIATPLTNEFYLNHASSYVLEHDMNRFKHDIRPETSVGGLFITGQDLISCGLSTAIASGAITASAILGYTAWDMLLLNRNIITDTINLQTLLDEGAAPSKEE